MITTLAIVWFLIYSHPEPCELPLVKAMEHVESHGNTWAVGKDDDRGLMQVVPKWADVPAWALHIPAVNRWEGCRILQRWQKHAKARCRWERRRGYRSRCRRLSRAVAGYNAGFPGIKAESTAGADYARKVLATRRNRVY